MSRMQPDSFIISNLNILKQNIESQPIHANTDDRDRWKLSDKIFKAAR